jgi:glutamate synthase domain-containing protein 1
MVHREIEEYAHNLNLEYLKQNKNKPNLAVASLSGQKIIYKGMLLPHEVKFFSDLKSVNPTQIIYHIR